MSSRVLRSAPKAAKPKDAAYFAAVRAQQRDALPRGGLRAGSGYHYERRYESENEDAVITDGDYEPEDDVEALVAFRQVWDEEEKEEPPREAPPATPDGIKIVWY
jgi:hypothetical protein